MQPPCNNNVSADRLNCMESFYPLHTYVCGSCFLVQLQEYVSPKAIFSEYAYFSSYSEEWLEHAKRYVSMITGRLGLNGSSWVVEVASNDGYLLQYFVEKGIPVLGVEPAANVAEAAVKRGVPTLVEFFNLETARRLVAERGGADLLIGNNVLAQVPNLNEFVESLRVLLGASGVITMEFPHLARLMEWNQFDTIYHEHFSYFSFTTVEKLFGAHGLRIFDVEELPTHGGSLRIYAGHVGDDSKSVSSRVVELRDRERAEGLTELKSYFLFAERVRETKRSLLDFLIRVKRGGKSVVGYGAPGKGNTLLNYCGVRSDFLDYTVDRNPYKQGKFLPGTHIPIFDPGRIEETKPDYVLILPWNIKGEVMRQLSFIGDWGGRFVVPIPRVIVYDASGVEVAGSDLQLGGV